MEKKDKRYVKEQLSLAWKALRKVQRQSKDKREAHLEDLAEHYASRRQTTKENEIKKLKHTEEIRKTAAKHKWYLKERHGMIRTLLVQDYRVHQILSILGALALTVLLGAFSTGGIGFSNDAMLVRALPWSVFTVWSQITAHYGWKVLTDEELITKRILRRNSSHLSMSGDTPFARGHLANDI